MKNKKIMALSLAVCVLLADEFNVNNENSTNAENATGGGALKTYELEASEIVANTDETSKYSSGTSIGKSLLNSTPNANGDIGSALKILPNVQYDNAQTSSHTPGEIDTANISISGGLFYQNNFTLDGFTMNNDLNPIGMTDGVGGTSQGLRAGRSQGFNIDTSLLESITVLDSNIGAAYGGFTGGVVEANVRNPRTDGFHFDINYQHTSDKLTTYHIDEQFEENLINSTDEKFQPKFTKHLVKTSLEGWLNEKFGLIGAFSTTRSKIPLNAYSTSMQYFNGTQAFGKRNQTRKSDNYYLKMIYNLSSDFSLEANLGYMPQFNTYFSDITKDSFRTYESGGYQAGLKGILDSKIGLWTNSLGYSLLQNSRRSDSNYYLTWRFSPEDKNWASTSVGYAMEGGVADIDQVQHSLSYKSDMRFNALEFLALEHQFQVGAELSYQYVAREILNDYYQNLSISGVGYTADLQGQSCDGSIDLFGVPLCSTATTTQTGTSNLLKERQGQYIKRLNVLKKSLTKLDVQSYAFYAQDDIKIFEFDTIGRLNARVGVRFDGDNYMDKDSIAPRLALGYVMPWKTHQTRLNFGANRYYGRNLFSYRLYDSILKATKQLERADVSAEWVESDIQNVKSDYTFNKLDIPYSDEFMVGLSQDISTINFNAKYIKREGKDEITQRGTYNNYYYSNDGRSTSDIVSISVENIVPINTYNIAHHFLLAFDRTLTQRSYNLFAADESYIKDPDILYDGKVIKYSERPTENFATPYTIRLNATQTMKLGSTRLLFNNFFRYRSGYDRMVRCLNARVCSNYDSSHADKDQYNKYHFKGVFNWDMRLGFEFRVDSLLKKKVDAGMFYANVDIINVLNSKNMTSISGANGNLSAGTILSTTAAYPVYDVGRQFWLQFGYKY